MNLSRTYKLERAILGGGTWQNTDFTESYLSETVFWGATLKHCVFDAAELLGTRFLGCLLVDCSFREIPRTIPKYGQDASQTYMPGDAVWAVALKAHSTKFLGCSFSGAYMSGCALVQSSLIECRFNSVCMENWYVTSSTVHGGSMVNCSGDRWQWSDLYGKSVVALDPEPRRWFSSVIGIDPVYVQSIN